MWVTFSEGSSALAVQKLSGTEVSNHPDKEVTQIKFARFSPKY